MNKVDKFSLKEPKENIGQEEEKLSEIRKIRKNPTFNEKTGTINIGSLLEQAEDVSKKLRVDNFKFDVDMFGVLQKDLPSDVRALRAKFLIKLNKYYYTLF